MENRTLWIKCGFAGIASVACYLTAILVPWPDNRLGTSTIMLVISGFPILGIIFSYGILNLVAAEKDCTANRLGFVFAVAAFTMMLGMIIAQLAVGAGIGEMTKSLDATTAKALHRALRLVDLGLDVAWDLLIGTAMIFWGVALSGRSGFGPGWGVPLVVLGIALILLNTATFPWPPADRGLVDIGPFIALYFVAIGIRLIMPGKKNVG